MYVISRLRLDCATPVMESEPDSLLRVECVTKGYIGGKAEFIIGYKPTFIRVQIFHISRHVSDLLLADQFLNLYHANNIQYEAEFVPLIRKVIDGNHQVNNLHAAFAEMVRAHIKVVQEHIAEEAALQATQSSTTIGSPRSDASKRVRFQ